MIKWQSIITIILALLLSFPSMAQEMNNSVEMADILHQNGKIYLVLLVVLTIFAGVLVMLFRIERKLLQLEKKQLHSQA